MGKEILAGHLGRGPGLALSARWALGRPGRASSLCRVKPSQSWSHLLLLVEFVMNI